MRRSPDLWAFWLPALAEVRERPEFAALARDIGLCDYWSEYRWNSFCVRQDNDAFVCS